MENTDYQSWVSILSPLLYFPLSRRAERNAASPVLVIRAAGEAKGYSLDT
ncbi:MAG: hypothetical protein ACE5JS_05245 [Nitrospinota bacterium]